MIIDNAGEITTGIYLLGHPGIPSYLIDGERPAIIDTGFSFMGDIYASDIRRILGDRQPAYCLLTHVHFDHCGATSVLKAHFPGMQVAASPIGKSILDKPGAVERIKQLNLAAESAIGGLGIRVPEAAPFEPFDIDIQLSHGDRLALSDTISVRAIESPGHTRDTLSFYIPERRVLFPSEAAGIPDQTGYIVIDCLLDYDQYVDSLKSLCGLEIETLCLGHRWACTGDDARSYMERALEHCDLFFHTTCRFLEEEQGNIGNVIQRIREFEYDPKPQPKQPEPAYLINLEARVKAVARKLAVGRSPNF